MTETFLARIYHAQINHAALPAQFYFALTGQLRRGRQAGPAHAGPIPEVGGAGATVRFSCRIWDYTACRSSCEIYRQAGRRLAVLPE